MCVCVLVCIYMCVLGGKGKLTEPLWQVVHSSNTNSVKFLSCHRNKDGDSPLRFSQTTQYFTHGSEFSHIWDFIGQKQCHKQYLTILTFNIFTYALMLWCVCVCVCVWLVTWFSYYVMFCLWCTNYNLIVLLMFIPYVFANN